MANNDSRVAIIVAIIGLVGVLSAAVIANFDKLRNIRSPGNVNNSNIVSSSPSPSTSPTNSPIPQSNSPVSFYIDYRGEPEPGIRSWSRTNEGTWIERYPIGTVTVHKILERGAIDGDSGTIIGNYQDFQLFIPDKDSKLLWARFRHKVQGQWQEWKFLGEMKNVQ